MCVGDRGSRRGPTHTLVKAAAVASQPAPRPHRTMIMVGGVWGAGGGVGLEGAPSDRSLTMYWRVPNEVFLAYLAKNGVLAQVMWQLSARRGAPRGRIRCLYGGICPGAKMTADALHIG